MLYYVQVGSAFFLIYNAYYLDYYDITGSFYETYIDIIMINKLKICSQIHIICTSSMYYMKHILY